MRRIFYHNNKAYVVLREIRFHNVENKDGSHNIQVIKAWMEHEGVDHVLRQNDKYLICDTIKDIEWEEVVYTDEASM